MTVHGLLSCAILTASLGQIQADEPDELPDLTQLSVEELSNVKVATVYGASRYEQEVTRAPASVSLVTSEDIRNFGYRTLADVLRSVRGITIFDDRNYSYFGVRGFSRPGDYNSRM